MAAYKITNLTFTYPNRTAPALHGLNLIIREGELVAVCGQSGSGKSTMLRTLKPVLAPSGTRTGTIEYDGRPLESLDAREQASRIGYVFQNPDNQIVTDKVWHELAFGLESLGLDTATIRMRVAEMASFFGIQNWFHRDVNTLSGGQKQILNLAAVMVMQPDVLILDEPTSQLDPIAARDFLETVSRINRELGTTVIITEHRLEEVLPIADRAVVLDGGCIIADAPPCQIGQSLADKEHPMLLAMPSPLQAYELLAKEVAAGTVKLPQGADALQCPLDVREGRQWLSKLLDGVNVKYTKLHDSDGAPETDNVIEINDLWFKYEKNSADVIRDLNMSVKRGEFLAIVGGNGTGKTTALSLMAGIHKPYRGKIKCAHKTGMLPQNPQTLFVGSTVLEDLQNMTGDSEAIMNVAEQVEITQLLESHPYDLSGGEQQRAALAKVLLTEPDILLLDEPTKGLDNSFKLKLSRILKSLQANGKTIVMVSHDVEFCALYADRCAMFFDGNVVTTGTPRQFFSGNSFYTTAANRMSRHKFVNAVNAQDVVDLVKANLGGEPPERAIKESCNHAAITHGSAIKETCDNAEETSDNKSSSTSKRKGTSTLALDLIMLALTAATIFVGFFVFENKHYFAVCVLMVMYAMVPFFARFERKKPQAREIVIIAVLIATAVVGRAAFFMVPNFKPIVAIVIIAGVSLGKESGFLVGAMSAFVSNFIFGQGPWTPWQMIAMALIGYLAGALFSRYAPAIGNKSGTRWALVVFGAVATFFLYGAIVDLWTILVMTPEPTIATAVTVYGAAVYFNLVHAAATVIFLTILARPIIGKLERVKLKYGV